MAHDFGSGRRFERAGTGSHAAGSAQRGTARREQRTGLYWLFLIPAAATLLPWIFNSRSPELIGIPFFYWYLLAWVPLTVILTVWVYRATRRRS